MPDNQLVWLRNDLRSSDNPALSAARAQGPVVAVFAITGKQWQEHNDSPAKLGLMHAVLTELAGELASQGVPLKIISADYYHELPKKLLQLATKLEIAELHFNREYPVNEARRDQNVVDAFKLQDIATQQHHGDVILPPGTVLNGQGHMFQVFTPFSKAWRKRVAPEQLNPLNKPRKQEQPTAKGKTINADKIPNFGGEFRQDLWPADNTAIKKRLAQFCQAGLGEYSDARDLPAQRGTSLLSPYLAIGALSVRQCIAQVLRQDPDHGFYSHWVTELIWREFYRHLMAAKPHLSYGNCFRPAGENVQWRKPELFEQWCQGQTGVPIVDAGMRQLLRTGWMHNRVRMITAAFLSKLMLIDWHLGETHFMQHLIDGDFASNNGGWQWSASVGADAAPYFRIFNPYRQAEKFDPDGDYVRRFVPELESLPGKQIHQPTPSQCKQLGYPEPIIDYKLARQEAMDTFAKAFKSA